MIVISIRDGKSRLENDIINRAQQLWHIHRVVELVVLGLGGGRHGRKGAPGGLLNSKR